MNIKKLISIAGSLLMLVSLVFIGQRLIQYGIDFSIITTTVAIGLAVVIIFEASIILLAGLNYRALVTNISGVKFPASLGMVVYSLSNVYKYIPGGLLYFAGRNRLAVEVKGLSHTKVALATVLEAVLFVVTCVALIAALVFDHFLSYLGNRAGLIFSIVAAVILLIAVLAFIFHRRISKMFADIEMPGCMGEQFEIRTPQGFGFQTTSPLWPMIIKRLLNTFMLMVLWGAAFATAITVLGQPMSFGLFKQIMGLYSLAWLVGYITPGAPSGIGIREAIILMFMGGIMDESFVISAMMMHRVVAISGDVLAYATARGIAVFYKS